MNKPILDPCCGGRMFYFNKINPAVLFCDNRSFSGKMSDGRNFEVNPDIICDVTKLPFPDEYFYHVIFDPPQLTSCTDKSDMAIHYTRLTKPWEPFIHDGFWECWRVLKQYGTLIFKWNEHDIKVKRIIECIGIEPIYGQKNRRNSKTHWMCFMKIPEEAESDER